jgi:phosphinothricin acetyltransferase
MIQIRRAVPNDAQTLAALYGYYVEHTAISFEYRAPTPEEFRRRIVKTLERYPYLVLEEDGRIQGYAYAGPFGVREAYQYACEVSIYLERSARGRGYGRRLYEALEEQLIKQGIRNLYACIADPIEEDEYLNRNSEEFHTHLGFEKVGTFHRCGYKFQRWYNMIWMEKLLFEEK